MPLIGQAALGNQHADGYTAEYYAPSTHKKNKQVIQNINRDCRRIKSDLSTFILSTDGDILFVLAEI